MGKRISDWIGQYRCMDWAVLYLRLFTAAGSMLSVMICTIAYGWLKSCSPSDGRRKKSFSHTRNMVQ